MESGSIFISFNRAFGLVKFLIKGVWISEGKLYVVAFLWVMFIATISQVCSKHYSQFLVESSAALCQQWFVSMTI